ncbi:MAG: transporter [Deltaproteobacteria bacterium]|nr:transporter [Deltaproteobacteria bacterium]MBS1244383.1 transporter [Deltaproteobacteria bacterium]
MKNRTFIVTAACISAAVFLFMTVESFARVGGSRSSGSRGSRSMSTPTRSSTPSTPSATSTSPSTSTSATPAPGATPSQVPPPQTGGFMRGMMGGLAGGFLGSMLFGGMGGMGDGGGVGILEIILLGGLAYLGYRFFMKRRQEQAAWAPQGAGTTPGPYSGLTAVADTAGEDRNKGLEYIRRMDPSFDAKAFGETASDAFFRLQGGWTRRDLSPVSGLLTDEMRATLQADADALKAKGQINRLENISVRNVAITEAWQESGQDFVTVLFQANLLDYTTDEAGKVLSGSEGVPVKFEEFWTFTRPVGPGAWRLSAIQQTS